MARASAHLEVRLDDEVAVLQGVRRDPDQQDRARAVAHQRAIVGVFDVELDQVVEAADLAEVELSLPAWKSHTQSSPQFDAK